MINKEKIRLMAKAASYESSGYRQDSFAKRFYKKDYVGLEKLKSRIWLTIFYAICIVCFAIDEFYVKGADLLHYDYIGLAINVLLGYVVLLLIVSGVTAMVHGNRYDAAKKRMDQYYETLEKINNID